MTQVDFISTLIEECAELIRVFGNPSQSLANLSFALNSVFTASKDNENFVGLFNEQDLDVLPELYKFLRLLEQNAAELDVDIDLDLTVND